MSKKRKGLKLTQEEGANGAPVEILGELLMAHGRIVNTTTEYLVWNSVAIGIYVEPETGDTRLGIKQAGAPSVLEFGNRLREHLEKATAEWLSEHYDEIREQALKNTKVGGPVQ